MPPRKPDAEKLSAIVRVRFKQSELEAIKENAAIWGMNPSLYIRSITTGAPPKKAPIPLIDRHAYAELGKIGNNINQMARSLNQVHGVYPNQSDLIDAMNTLKDQIKAIRLELMKAR